MSMNRKLLLLLMLFILQKTARSQSTYECNQLFDAGCNLTLSKVNKLREIIEAEPKNIDARIQLIGYYSSNRGRWDRYKDAEAVHQELILYLIEHHPELPVFRLKNVNIFPAKNPSGHALAAELWQKNILTHRDSAPVLANAAHFYRFTDSGQQEQLLKRTHELEPDNFRWSLELAQYYQGRIYRLSGEERLLVAAKSLEYYEKVLKPSDQKPEWYWSMDDIAHVAFEAGDLKKAEEYARQLLQMTKKREIARVTYNAVHHGNTVLGRIALKAGDKEKAKTHLLKSARSRGLSWNVVEPNMTLARELLDQGEREAVLEYLRKCTEFHKRTELKQWIKIAEQGGTPDFGVNVK